MTLGLMPLERRIRDRCRTICNAFDTLERLELAHAWGAPSSDEKRANAVKTIETAILQMADMVGVKPKEQQMYRDIITRLQEENARLTAANAAILHGQAA